MSATVRTSRAALKRMVGLAQRSTTDADRDHRRRAAAFGDGVEREILGIAQEALTNAVRHSRARRITMHASTVRASACGCRSRTTAAASARTVSPGSA